MKKYFKYLIITAMFVFAVTTSCEEDKTFFVVTFNSNGGSSVDSITVNEGAKIVEPAAPTLDHYGFDGWYMDNNIFEYKWNFAHNTVPENIMLHAKWKKKIYTVTFNSNGGSIVEAIENLKSGEKIDEPAAPTRNKYSFIGWFTDNNTFANEWDFDVNTITEDVTLHAKWKEKFYTVTFNSNDGSIVEAIENLKSGEKIDEPAAPTRDKYSFIGWFTDNNTFANEWDFDVNTVTADVTLYAKWSLKYKIVEFTLSTNWIVPAGVTFVDVFCVGGGGSGAGDGFYAGHSGSGANGGVVTYMQNVSVVPGTSIQITVGAGGIGGVGTRGEGRQGGASSFGNLVSSDGGYGGVSPPPNTSSQPEAQPNSGRGGKRGNDDGTYRENMQGGDGIECPFYSTGEKYGAGGAGANTAYQQTSLQQYGGATGGGDSGYGANNTPENRGSDATFYGGGGGGGAFSSDHTYSLGGNGSSGIVIIRY